MLYEKLQSLERKIIVGGENLLEKAEEQERLLAMSQAELDQRRQCEKQLREQLEEKEVCISSTLLFFIYLFLA